MPKKGVTVDPPQLVTETLIQIDQLYRTIETYIMTELTENPEVQKQIENAFLFYRDFEFDDYLNMKKHRTRIQRYVERNGLQGLKVTTIGDTLRFQLKRGSYPFSTSIMKGLSGVAKLIEWKTRLNEVELKQNKELFEVADRAFEWLTLLRSTLCQVAL